MPLLSMTSSTFAVRLAAGNLKAATIAEVLTLLNVEAGAQVNPTFRGCLAYDKSATTLATTQNVFRTVPFDSEKYDTDGIHSTSTNTTRLTVPSGVTKIKLSGATYWSVLSAKDYTTWLMPSKNGYLNTIADFFGKTMMIQDKSDTAFGDTFDHAQAFQTPMIEVVATDYFELTVGHSTREGSADNQSIRLINVASGAGYPWTWFAMEIIE